MDPLINRQLGNYRLERKLGAGACGVVYKAQHVKLGTPFAVKILHPLLASNTESAERFLREARTAARIGHENVVFIADFDVEEGIGPYFVMEYLDGESLRQNLDRESPFGAEKVATLCEQMCHALAAAHRLGVVHRDLKPDNIMISPRPSRQLVKILDFGIAKITSPLEAERIDLTQSGHILGTPRYFSPEQAQGNEIDHRSDIYSFGIILYEMLKGHTPFQGKTPEEMRFQHIFDPPPPLGDAFPNELQDLLDWLLSKHVDERPDDMDEVWSLLKEALPLIKRFDIPQEEIRETQRVPGIPSALEPQSTPIVHTSGYQEDKGLAAVRDLGIRTNNTIPLGASEHDVPESSNFLAQSARVSNLQIGEQAILDEEHTFHEKMLSQEDNGEEGPTIYDPAAKLRKLLLASTQTIDGTDEIELPNAEDDEDEGATVVAPLQGEEDDAPPTVIAQHRPAGRSNNEEIDVAVHASILDAEDTATHPIHGDVAKHFANLPSVSDDDLPTAIARPAESIEHTMQGHVANAYHPAEPRHHHGTPPPRGQHTLQGHPSPLRHAPESAASAFLSDEGPPTQESLYAAQAAYPNAAYPNGNPAPQPAQSPAHPRPSVDALLDAEPLYVNDEPWRSDWVQRWRKLNVAQKLGVTGIAALTIFLVFWGISSFLHNPPPPPKLCESMLKTAPAHAAVWLDNKLLGYTPYLLRRACATKVTLRFYKQGYLTKSQEVRLSEENSELMLPLQSDPQANAEFAVQVFSTPSQAAIYSDQEQFICNTPCTLKAPHKSQRIYTIKKRVRRRRTKRLKQMRFSIRFEPPQQSLHLRLR
ncbi:MAG: serine/threonine protein kinase [Myxococcales bacterium]|nr:serine/threonine protein kinase [Myxococcales bacterium]